MVKTVLIGGGNVASHLIQEFITTQGIQLLQVYNRSIDSVKHLPKDIDVTNDISRLKDADVYVIAIADDAITEVSKQLNLPNKLVVHTSGSVAMDSLKGKSFKGVFYPLQTFTKEKKVNFKEIPLCIEAERNSDLELLNKLANLISDNVYFINSEQRKSLHVAAVFVNNFVNHLYSIGHDICENNQVPFEILHPLIQETAQKILSLQPKEAQTGPAKRNDVNTINHHLQQLTNKQQEIYTLLTQSIQNTYGKKL